jgi:hypothetical protein
VICLLFEVCDLEFLVISVDCGKEERALNRLQGSPKAGSFGSGFFTLKSTTFSGKLIHFDQSHFFVLGWIYYQPGYFMNRNGFMNNAGDLTD